MCESWCELPGDDALVDACVCMCVSGCAGAWLSVCELHEGEGSMVKRNVYSFNSITVFWCLNFFSFYTVDKIDF